LAEKKIRVHNLADELQVSSKVIIEKCKAEGIEVKNHMHVVGAGLAATIREWFSEGSHATTLEESSRVDLEAAKAARPKKAKKVSSKAAGKEGNVATLEAPPEIAEAPPEPTLDEPLIEEPLPELETLAPATPAEPEAEPTELPQIAAEVETPVVEPDPVVAEEPAPPKRYRPAASAPAAPQAPSAAGPQNVPRPAQLSGPKIVRIEKPDVLHPPRPSVRPTAPRPPRGPIGPPRTPPFEEEGSERRGTHGRPAARKGLGKDGAAEADRAAPPKRAIKDERDDVAEKLREWRDRDLIERRDRLAHASGRGIGGLRAIEGKQTSRRTAGKQQTTIAPRKDKIDLFEPVTVKAFSYATGMTVSDLVKKLMTDYQEMAGMNTTIKPDVAQVIAAEIGIDLTILQPKTQLDVLQEEFAALPRAHMAPRPPVVTVLGHVDHGKTSLLDRIRSANVAKGEAGGITQHIGAYRVQVKDKWVTFLDTPGHTAFTEMRARGANMTDVVVLVVAADDGVMPTTIEAISHARAAGTTIVVALNKIDLPHDINKLYGQLAEHNLSPAEWGGETDLVKTSATSGLGVDELLAHLATLSDVMELKADATIPATGTVIEAHRSEGLGNVARILVQEGTLKPGVTIVCGSGHGKVRSIRDEYGRPIKSAGPSTPVEVTGLSEVPQAGDKFYVVESAQLAKEIAEEVAARRREAELTRLDKPTSLENMLANAADGQIPELRVIIRADVQGSGDVLKKALSDFPQDQVKLDILLCGIGNVTESDVVLAQASKAIIIAFHVAPDSAVQRRADQVGVDIRSYLVIYEVIDDIRKALEGLLTPDEKIESRGKAEVREIFGISKVGKIAGCFMRDGLINRNHLVRIVRDGVIIKDMCKIESLRRFKDDVKEVKSGFECGIRIVGFDDIKPGDVIESFEVIKIARKLDS
jgi:translation initiation factor IF-2